MFICCLFSPTGIKVCLYCVGEIGNCKEQLFEAELTSGASALTNTSRSHIGGALSLGAILLWWRMFEMVSGKFV